MSGRRIWANDWWGTDSHSRESFRGQVTCFCSLLRQSRSHLRPIWPFMTVLCVAVADLHKELVLSLPAPPPPTLSFRGRWTPHQACCAVSRPAGWGSSKVRVGSGSPAGSALAPVGGDRKPNSSPGWLGCPTANRDLSPALVLRLCRMFG